jgi:AcrR family transcriptional regulator
MAAKIVDKDKRKKEIAYVALELFAENGFEATSISRIAHAAGIGKGTVYEYFKSKDEIIAVSIMTWVELMVSEAKSDIESIDDPTERLLFFIQTTMESFMSDERHIKTAISIFQVLLTRMDISTHHEAIYDAFSKMGQTIIDIVMDGHKRGVFHIQNEEEARMIAINLMAFLDGIFLHYLITGKRFDLMEQVNHYMKYLLEANLRVRM